MRGLVFIAANCYAAIGVIDYPERYCADKDVSCAGPSQATDRAPLGAASDSERGGTLHERIVAGTRARLHYLWDVFADTFPAKPYLSGEHLGALDLLATVVSKWSGSREHLAKSRPEFRALLHEVESDPRIAAVFARHWP